jgi:glutamate-1-semialdehyde 2,1-aminomutase
VAEEMKKRLKSERAFAKAKGSIPGGVNSPVRAYGSVGGEPPFIARGQGPYIFDLDGNRYIDYVLSWGPLILGHAHPAVVEAIQKAAEKGTSFGAPTEAETELAELVRQFMPHIEMLRLVSSGTEAVMTAIRLARAHTGREWIIKFDGCYHGHSDAMLVKAGSGVATGDLPGTHGVPGAVVQSTLSLPYNDKKSVEEAFSQNANQIAAIIVEPIAANMGVVLPKDGFLRCLRELASRHGACLIFDEVITGFRVARGGAAELFQVKPDLVCLGKILGGGLPIGAVGGRREIMGQLAPAGNVYQAGTLSGNPISVAAGLATLKELVLPGRYEVLKKATQELALGLMRNFVEARVPAQINFACGILSVFFTSEEVRDFATAKTSTPEIFSRFFHAMLNQGIYLPASTCEAWFLSTELSPEIIAKTLTAQTAALKSSR